MLECTVIYENGSNVQVSLPASYFPRNEPNDFPSNPDADAISKFLKLSHEIKKVEVSYPNGIGGNTVDLVYNSNYRS